VLDHTIPEAALHVEVETQVPLSEIIVGNVDAEQVDGLTLENPTSHFPQAVASGGAEIYPLLQTLAPLHAAAGMQAAIHTSLPTGRLATGVFGGQEAANGPKKLKKPGGE